MPPEHPTSWGCLGAAGLGVVGGTVTKIFEFRKNSDTKGKKAGTSLVAAGFDSLPAQNWLSFQRLLLMG